MIPQETVDLILDTARVDDVISDFVTLKRRGASFVACCPFHNEKTPSFHVSPAKGIYKCFGCGKAGSAVGFIMEHEHCSYVEALRYLAKKYHIEIHEKEESMEDIAAKQRTESLMLVSDFAQKFFASNLSSGEGKTLGLAYLHSRGLDDDTIARFGLGWAPSGRTVFTDAALAAGYKPEYLVETGLCIRYDDGRLVDRFHERAMFPIHTVSGRVVAFSGRTLKSGGEVAKYVNSPETPIYIKSKALYGISLAKSAISKMDRCYLAEGNVDVVSMHQLGITNVVASCGTSLTEEQIRMIRKFTENITIMYDGDAAGIHAAIRAIGMILKEGMNVSVLLFPDGDDPDSFCRKHTLDEVRAFISENEKDFLSYLLQVTPGIDRDPLTKANFINSVADIIALMPDAVKRSVFVDTASRRLNVEQDAIFERINGQRKKQREEDIKAADRARRREEAGLDSSYDASAPAPLPEAAPEMPMSMDALLENKAVARVEMDLLGFILTNGTDELDFESDSDYYSGDESEKPLVADFIRMALEDDGYTFMNSVLTRVYEAYMEEFYAGYSQEDILRKLLNSEDRTVAFVTAELSVERYQLTVEKFEKSLTSTSSWLVKYVPRAILCFHESRLNYQLSKLRDSLMTAEAEEEQNSIMEEMQFTQQALKKVKLKLGRERKI